MHVIAFKDETVTADSELPRILLELYGQAKALVTTYMDDPGWSQLPWARLAREEQNDLLKGDLWPVGFAANRANVERFILYSHDQGLIDRQLSPDALFHDSVLDT